MSDGLYDERPAFYDAIQSDWPYDRDLRFVLDAFDNQDVTGDRVLDIGCGTGEHTCRLVERGYEVMAIDQHRAMLDRARTKCDADFRQVTLPDLSLDVRFDAAIAIRGVVNHLPPDALSPSLSAIAASLGSGGVLVFDNAPLPPNGNHPALAVGTTDRGDYGRIAHHVPTGDGRLEWRAITFVPDGSFFVDSRRMTPFEDETITAELDRLGFEVVHHDGYGPDDDRTVFVAVLAED